MQNVRLETQNFIVISLLKGVDYQQEIENAQQQQQER